MKVKLTPAQYEVVRWALGGMESLSNDDMIELWGEIRDFRIEDVLRKDVLDISNWTSGMVKYLLYRLTEQLPDMVDGADYNEFPKALGQVRAARNVAGKIKQVLGWR